MSLSVAALVCALSIAVLYILGLKADDLVISGSGLLVGKEAWLRLLPFFLLMVLIAFFVIRWIYSFYDRHSSASDPESVGFFRVVQIRSLSRYFFILFLAWMPYWIIRFPGNLDPDTEWQFLQFYGFTPFSDHHPFFDNALFAAFWKMGDLLGSNRWSLFLYAVFQMAATAFVMAAVIEYLKLREIPRTFLLFALLYFAFFPIIPLFSHTMAKDMLHGWIFLFFSLMMIYIVDMRGVVNEKPVWFWLLFSLVLLFVMLTKKTGIYVVLLSSLLCLPVLERRLPFCASCLIPMLLFSLVWSQILLPLWNVQPGAKREMMSVPSQQIGYLVQRYPELLSEEDYEVINSVFWDVEALGQEYTPCRADTAKRHFREDSGKPAYFAFLRWYLQQYWLHPREMLVPVLALDYPLLLVDTTSSGDESLIFYRDNIASAENPEADNSEWFANKAKTDVDSIRNVMISSYRDPVAAERSASFNDLFQKIMNQLPLLFSKVLFATWIPLMLLVYVLRRKSYRGFLMLLPDLLSTAILIVGPIVLPRYMVTSVYLMPLMLCVPFLINGSPAPGSFRSRRLHPIP